MFLSELENIERTLNYPGIVRNRRLRAWYEFRDQSEPLELIGHTDPPFRSVLEIRPEVDYPTCPRCGRQFLTTEQRDHHSAVAHPSKPAHPVPVPANPALVDPVVLARRVAAQDEIPRRPVIIDGCNVDELIAAVEGRAA